MENIKIKYNKNNEIESQVKIQEGDQIFITTDEGYIVVNDSYITKYSKHDEQQWLIETPNIVINSIIQTTQQE